MTLRPEDRQAISDLLIGADDLATKRDAAAYAELFATDGVLDGAKGEHNGRQEIREATELVWRSEPQGTSHLTMNLIITPESEDAATATSTLLIIASKPSLEVWAIASIQHRVVRVDGEWLVARRTVS